MKNRLLIATPLLIAFAIVGVRAGPELYDWASHKRVYFSMRIGQGPDARVMGYHTVRRWGDTEGGDGRFVCWYVETGRLNYLGQTSEPYRRTEWRLDGEIGGQYGRGWARNMPPWLWEVKPQTEPSAPWIREGMTADEWWDELPESQRVED